ncbi:MAG: hypothetical protein R2847_09835 [Bacteroidia bacterium]
MYQSPNQMIFEFIATNVNTQIPSRLQYSLFSFSLILGKWRFRSGDETHEMPATISSLNQHVHGIVRLGFVNVQTSIQKTDAQYTIGSRIFISEVVVSVA